MNASDPRNIFVNNREDYQDGQKTENKQSKQQTNTQNAQESNQTNNYQQRLEQMQRLAEKYRKEGESQLVQDIVNNVLQQKAKGELTNQQLTAFANRVSPLLNTEQKQRLDGLMQELLKL